MHRVVVLGAGYAGLPAVNRIAKQTFRDEVELVLVSTHDQFVERPRLHQLASGQSRPSLPLRDFLRSGIDLRVGRVQRLDVGSRALNFGAPDRPWSLPYDTLLYAAGSTIDLEVPGAAVHAHSVATPESARRIASLLGDAPTARVVVCGGGLSGIELASEFADSNPALEVTLVTRDQLGDWLSPRARSYVRDAMNELGVHVLDQTVVFRVQPHHLQTSGEDVPFDVCVWAGGFVFPQLAAQAGLQVDAAGRVVTDASLRSVSHDDVYAIGDAAAVPGPWGTALAMGCRTGGFTGPTAADAVVARLAGRTGPTFTFRYLHECIGLGRRRHVIQFVDKDGQAVSRTLRDHKATLYKNLVLDAGRWTGKHPGPYRPTRRRHVVLSTPTPYPPTTWPAASHDGSQTSHDPFMSSRNRGPLTCGNSAAIRGAGKDQLAASDSRSTRPVEPSTRMRSPVLSRAVAFPHPTTAGIPSSRATIAAWDSGARTSVTTAPARGNSGVQPTLVVVVTSTSPGWSSAPSAAFWITRTVPSTTPAEPGNPRM